MDNLLTKIQEAHLTMADNVTIILAVVVIFFVIKAVSRQAQDMDSYYRANKSLPWSLAVGTIAASWYGGNGTIGTVGYVGTMGLAAFFIWSFGCHLTRFPLALWVAPRISVKLNTTMVELLNRFYGRVASVLGAIVLVASSLCISELAAAGYVGEGAWNANKYIFAIIVLVISITLSWMGGLLGVAITDMVFFFLMINSVALVFPKALSMIGGIKGMEAILNPIDPNLMTPFGGLPIGQAAVLILLCINLYKDPAFYQRFSASNGPKTGKRAMLTCFTIWLTMDMCLMLTGMIIRCIDPDMVYQPEVMYIKLVISYLPPVARGMFIVGMMGAIISTIDSYYLIGGEIVSNDIISPMLKKALTPKQSISITRITMICMGIIAFVSCFQFPLVYDAMIFLMSLSMSILFWPVLIAIMYEGKKTDAAGLLSMIAGAICWIWFKFNPISVEALGGELDPVLICLPVGLIAYLIGNCFGKVHATSYTDEPEGVAVEAGKLVSGSPEYKAAMKVEWFGIDGFLVVLYFVAGAIIMWGMINRVDWPIMYFAPGCAALMTTGIFCRYLFEVFTFGKTGGKKKK